MSNTLARPARKIHEFFQSRADKARKERVRRVGAGFEFGMELYAHVKALFGKFYRLHEFSVGETPEIQSPFPAILRGTR